MAFLRIRERDGEGLESSRSTLAVNVYQNETAVDPRGLPAVLFRVPVGLRYTVVPTSSPHGPAVCSDGVAALHMAANFGNRRIVRLLIASKADVDAQDQFHGCTFSLRRRRVGWPSLRRLPCRWTPLHSAASSGASDAIAELLLRGADGAVQNDRG